MFGTRASSKGLLLGSEIRSSLITPGPGTKPRSGPRPGQRLKDIESLLLSGDTRLREEFPQSVSRISDPKRIPFKGALKGFSNDIESEGLFRTSGNSKSLFVVFGSGKRLIDSYKSLIEPLIRVL